MNFPLSERIEAWEYCSSISSGLSSMIFSLTSKASSFLFRCDKISDLTDKMSKDSGSSSRYLSK